MRRLRRGDREGRPTGNRVLLAGVIGVASALLVPFGCGVDYLPGLPNETPNPHIGSMLSGAGGGGGVSVGGAGGGGPASVCECAAAAFSGKNVNCGVCLKAVTAPGQACNAVGTACSTDP